MAKHTEMLPQCIEREATASAKMDDAIASLRRIERAVLGNGAVGLKDQVARHSAYWRLFSVVAAIITVMAAVVGMVAAATK